MAAIIGCRIVVSIAKRPDHGPENTTAATSAHSTIVMTILLVCLVRGNRRHGSLFSNRRTDRPPHGEMWTRRGTGLKMMAAMKTPGAGHSWPGGKRLILLAAPLWRRPLRKSGAPNLS